MAAAFTDLVKSFVSAILMPPIAVIFPLNKNIEEKFAVLRRGDKSNSTEDYNTMQQALDDGAVVMAYGCVLPTHAKYQTLLVMLLMLLTQNT